MEDSDDVFVDAVEEIIDNEDEDNNKLEPEMKMADFNYDDYTVTSDGLVRY